jgi:uncharacterized membrane protein
MSENAEYDPKLEALKIILDARRHEIDLVWKRGLFFWGFVALAAAGTGHALTHGESHLYLAMVTSGLGAVASFASYLAARGSKRWQEIWELRAEIAEAEVIGRLFDSTQDIYQLKQCRDNLRAKSGECNVECKWDKKTQLLSQGEFSVSKLHVLLNLFSFVTFLMAFILVCIFWSSINFSQNFDLVKMFAIGCAAFLLAVFLCLAYCCCRSSDGPHSIMKLK